MTRGLLLPSVTNSTDPALLKAVQEGGYDRIWAGELWGTDAFVRLTHEVTELGGDGSADVDGAAPSEVQFGTAIVNVYSRTPAALAQTAATMADQYGEPFRLGLGPSTRVAVENLHDCDYEGDLFEVSGFPGLDADVEIYTAALGPAARRATGRVADGWLPHNVPFPDLEESFETIERTARTAGRGPDEIRVAPYVPAAVCETEAEARDLIAGHVAYYVGSGEGYREAVSHRFPSAADAVSEAWRDGTHATAREAVTEEMIDALGVAGTFETAPNLFRDVAKTAPIDEPIVVVPTRADAETTRRTVEALAPNADRNGR